MKRIAGSKFNRHLIVFVNVRPHSKSYWGIVLWNMKDIDNLYKTNLQNNMIFKSDKLKLKGITGSKFNRFGDILGNYLTSISNICVMEYKRQRLLQHKTKN